MRKLVASAAVLALTAVFVTVALAQEQVTTHVTVKATITPNKAGTKKHPQPVKLGFKVHWESENGVEPPVITAATAFIPKGGIYNGAKYPKCAEATLNRKGLKACPKHSIMGTASASAFADTTITHPKITFVNGGAKKICFFTQLKNPARVNACASGTITKLSGGKYGYKLRIVVPETLQFVAGVPIALRDFNGSIGGKPYAKDYIVTTSCPKSKKYEYSVETEYLYSDNHTSKSPYTGSVACRS
jgi:hypothetical protein